MSRKPRYLLRRGMDEKGRFKRMLGRRFLVRLHMMLIMIAVVGAGLGVSKLLLVLGLRNMGVRYGLVVIGGVAVFLACIKLWLWYIHRSLVTDSHVDAEDMLDAADVALDATEAALEIADALPSTGGGEAAAALVEGGEGAHGEAVDTVADAGEGALGLLEGEEAGIILLAIGVVVAVFFGVGIFLIWQAPVILAEAAIPAILVAALRRKGRDIDHPHWTGSVLKAVWIPAVLALLVAVSAGFILEHYCPRAHTISEVMRFYVL